MCVSVCVMLINWFSQFVWLSFAQVMMVNNYEQNVVSLTKKLKHVTGLLEQKVLLSVLLSLKYCRFVVWYN